MFEYVIFGGREVMTNCLLLIEQLGERSIGHNFLSVLLAVGAHKCVKSVDLIHTVILLSDWHSNNEGRSSEAELTV